jgi:hypothetical protein
VIELFQDTLPPITRLVSMGASIEGFSDDQLLDKNSTELLRACVRKLSRERLSTLRKIAGERHLDEAKAILEKETN